MSTKFEEKDFSDKGFNLPMWKKLFIEFKPFMKYIYILIILNILIALSDVIFPLLNKTAINDFTGDVFNRQNFLILIASYFILILLTALAHLVYFKVAGKAEMGFGYYLREHCFKKLQSLSFSYYDVTPIGWLMARMTSDISRLAEVISWSFTEFAWGIPLMLFATVVMLTTNVTLALLVLIVVPFVAFCSVYFQTRILKAYREVRKSNSKITNAFNEGINGAKTTKTLVLEENNLHEFKEETTNMEKVSVKAARLSGIFRPLVQFISSFALAFVLWVGGQLVFEEMVDLGTLMMFTQYAQQFFEPIRNIAMILQDIQMAQASGERIIHLLDEKPSIVDKPEVIAKYGDIFNPQSHNYEPIIGDIEFKHVDFSYIPDEPILKDFNLKVKHGQTIALVGETGSGKSTIVNLLCRFYEPVKGEILIDGIDYRERSLGWLHSHLGYVLQAPHLFSGTIMENIRYGNLNASDEEVYEAAKLVDAHDFIMAFPEGYNTDVGEGGSRLSTGQKQLISFARAILAKPAIFVLDEATASIDTETERIIQYAIENIMKDKTSFVVAHRLSTIVNADRILVINKGQIIEDGRHNELMAQKGYYYRLYTNQFNEDLANRILKKA